MKKKLLSLLVFFPVLVSAQFSATVQAYYDFGVDRFNNKFYGGNVIGDYSVTKNFMLGVGIGIGGADLLYYENNTIGDSRDAATLMPVFADFRYKFNQTGISPYISVDAGYNFALSSNISNPGLFATPAFGVAFPVGKGAINVQVGYKYQRFKYDTYYFATSRLSYINNYSSHTTNKESCNEIEISVGYTFKL